MSELSHTSTMERRVLIIGTDGLRPDLVDPKQMPTYARLMEKGTLFTDFHAAYPPHTRVSMTTLTTGVYPGRHGVTNNIMFIPGFSDEGFLQTGNDRDLLKYKSVMREPLILCPTLGDRLFAAGKRLAVAASSSPGASLLWNLNHPMYVINSSSNYGEEQLVEWHKQLGPVREDQSRIKRERALWATRALIDIHLKNPENKVMVLWLSEPDASQHDYGLGSPEANEAMQLVDHCVAQVLEAVECQGWSEQLDILLISDHGHSTVDAQGTLKDLVESACREMDLQSSFIVADTFIYNDPQQAVCEEEVVQLVKWIQQQEWCDLVLAGHPCLRDMPGIFPLETVWGPISHSRIPLLAVSPAWTSGKNQFGVSGMMKTLTSSSSLQSQHGSLSPFDLHAFCLGYGPSFSKGSISDRPCGLIDIAPTISQIVGLGQEKEFDGRSLLEEEETWEQKVLIQTIDGDKRPISLSDFKGAKYIHGTGLINS